MIEDLFLLAGLAFGFVLLLCLCDVVAGWLVGDD